MNLMTNKSLAAPTATAFPVARAAAATVASRELTASLSPRGFAIGLYLEHLEEASFLYDQRCALLDDPEVRWIDLADFEKRLEAHVDALVLGSDLALGLCRQHAAFGDTGQYHAAISVICRQRRLDLLGAALAPLDPADDERIRTAGDALARELPREWDEVVSSMVTARHAGLRRIAAHVIGFRRLGDVARLDATVRAGGSYALPELIWALGRLRAGANATLAGILEGEPYEAIQWAATIALLRGGDRRPVVHGLRQAHRFPSLLLAVGLAGGRTDLRSLLKIHAQGVAETHCLLAMGFLGDVSAVEPLLAALQNDTTAEAATTALHLITGGDCYERAVIPETLQDDELFEGEKAGAPAESTPSCHTVTWLSRDPATWRTWWRENESRFQQFVRYREGRPYSPATVLRTLTGERNERRIRELAYDELVIRYGADVPFETDMLVVEQEQALAKLEQWVMSAEPLYRPGDWYFAERLLE